MIAIIFKEKDSNKRLVGYSTVDYKSNDENEVVKQTSESELNGLIPDSFEETDWKEVRQHYKLENGEIVFDEDYQPPTEVG